MNAKSSPPSPTHWALWVIACALSVITVCSLLLVWQQHSRLNRGREQSATDSTATAIDAESNQSAPKVPTRPSFKPAAPRPVVESSTTRSETNSDDSVSSAPNRAGGISSGAVIPSSRGGFAPLTGPTSTEVGEIAGRVVLNGTPPPEIRIQFDAVCGSLHQNPVTTRHYVIGTNGGLENVFVYIRSGLEGGSFLPPNEPAKLDSVGCLYEPYVGGVMVNQKLRIQNLDLFTENVHATPKASREFNIALPLQASVREVTFPRAEVLVRFKCDLHPWQFGYVGVVDHPFFAVTGQEGSFSITNVPAGDYVLEAYHLKTHGAKQGLTQSLSVKAGEVTTADFTIDLR